MLKATMFEFNRSDAGEPTVTAYLDEVAIATRYIRSAEHLIDFMSHFNSGEAVVRVAETNVEIIPEKPDINNAVRPLENLSIFLDAGHSKSQPGAHGLGSVATRPNEYQLNLLQAKVIQLECEKLGARVTFYDPDPDNLVAVGQRSAKHDVALFLHHNAANADGKDEGTETHIHPTSSKQTLELADMCTSRIASALATKNRGVKRSSFTVLRESVRVCSHPILVESYFVDDYLNKELCAARSRKAALAIVDAIVAWFK